MINRPLRKLKRLLFGNSLTRSLKESSLNIKGKQSPLYKRVFFNIVEWFEDKYVDIIQVPIETVQRFCYWGWKFRYHYDWECGHGVYYHLMIKSERLIKYSRHHAHLMWNSKEDGKEFRKLKIAHTLVTRLYNDDYHTNMDKHYSKWGSQIDILKHVKITHFVRSG